MNIKFPVEERAELKSKPVTDELGFGQYFTDYMFEMRYDGEHGWHDGKILPYGPIELEPSAEVFHHAQEMFEGLKAYKTVKDDIVLFRPDMNARRGNITNNRMCIPNIDENIYISAIKQLVELEKNWIPEGIGTSLYVRPFIIADEPCFSVRASKTYRFYIILSPTGSFYKEGIKPTRLYVEDEYVRAVPGGTGFAKVGGNYAAAFKAQEKAARAGCSQVLWLDSRDRKYVEEIGASNAFFVIDGEILTPSLEGGTILPGITRDSAITLLSEWGYNVTERKISIEEIYDAQFDGRLEEVFATGTAAVISPVGGLLWKGNSITINSGNTGEIAKRLYDTLTGIQLGKISDEHGWIEYVCKA